MDRPLNMLFLGPTRVNAWTTSRSVQPVSHGSRSW